MDDDFREWVLNKVKETPTEKMLEDNFFVCRLLNDVLWGRSKKFNRSKSNGKSQGLNMLESEYKEEVEMGLLICTKPKCGGSLIVLKDRDGKVRYKCNRCGAEYDKRPR